MEYQIKTWVWHKAWEQPVYIVDVINVLDKPVVAVPKIVMASDGRGADELTSSIYNLPVNWGDLVEIKSG